MDNVQVPLMSIVSTFPGKNCPQEYGGWSTGDGGLSFGYGHP